MHVNNANKTGTKGPKIQKHGVMKTGVVTADKAAAAPNLGLSKSLLRQL